MVNLARVIDSAVANPGSEGLTNVTTADPARSGTTALYHDDLHFGAKGHAIIARTIQGSLGTRARQVAEAAAASAA